MEDTHRKCAIFCSAMNIYLGLSVGLNVYNKYLMNQHKFPLFLLTVSPLLISACNKKYSHIHQTQCQFFFLFIMSGALIYSLLRTKLSLTPFWISKISLSTYTTKLLPIGFLYGGDFILTNIAIANGPIAFVQMIKSGIPLIVLFYKLFERNAQSISSSVILSMVLLFCGQLLIYFHEVEFSWICFIASLCALFSSATKIFVIEKLLKTKKTAPSTPLNDNSYSEHDIQSEGEQNKLNQTSDNEETAAFIGLDNFSPAELILTDESEDEGSSYYYNVDADKEAQKKENVQLQFVETNQRNKVKIKPKESAGKQATNG